MATPTQRPSHDPNEAFENPEDAALILGDQDETLDDELDHEDAMGADGGEDHPLSLENEPAEFIRGEVDVKTQMDRATEHSDYVGAFSDTRGARDEDFGKMGDGAGRAARDDDDEFDANEVLLSVDEATLQGEKLHKKTLTQLKADEANDA